MSDNTPESSSLRSAYAAASALKPVAKVELISHLVEEVPPLSLQGLSERARQKILKAPMDPAVRNERLEKALAILDTARLTPDYFYVKILEGVSDFETIDSLNCFFRERFTCPIASMSALPAIVN